MNIIYKIHGERLIIILKKSKKQFEIFRLINLFKR